MSDTGQDQLKILFVVSECAPYAKTGGLADAVSALAKQLAKRGHEVRLVMPLYSCIDREQYGLSEDGNACIHMGGQNEHWVGVHAGRLDDLLSVWFIDFPPFYERPGLYDEPDGEYRDNPYRYALLSRAALQLCKDRGFIPDVIHAHDWQGALTAVYLHVFEREDSPLSKTASVLTMHNIGYQGVYEQGVYEYIGTGDEYFVSDIFRQPPDCVNLLKAGIHFADALTTVSPTHAREILTDPSGAHGLEPQMKRRSRDFYGILNGVDYDVWNPETDTMIPAPYTASDLSGKMICKRVLQEKMGINVEPEWPLVGIISRFAPQKGFDLIRRALPAALDSHHMQAVILGTGDPATESFFSRLMDVYPGRLGCFLGFSTELSHLIEAGCDFFLMPSLYEPCGLNQIYSLRYGTLPIVRATGGLDDTVEAYDEQSGGGTGFKFRESNAGALFDCIDLAMDTWYNAPDDIEAMRRRAMHRHFSWNEAAAEYERVYHSAMEKY